MNKHTLLYSLTFFVLIGSALKAQNPLRYEIDADEYKNIVYVSLEKEGLLVLKETETKKAQTYWEIERLSADFKNLWQKQISVDKNKTPFKHELRSDSIIHIIFAEGDLIGGVKHYIINYYTGKINSFEYNYDNKVIVKNIEVIDERIFAAAYKKPKTIKQIGQFFYSLTFIPAITGSKITKIQPKIFIADKFIKSIDLKFENDAYILSSNIDTSRNVYCIIINESGRKTNKLIYYEINKNGEITAKAELNNLNINFLSSYLVFSDSNEIFFMGSYDYSFNQKKDKSEQALGIFFSKIDSSGFQIFKIHKFSEFENAIKILSERSYLKVKTTKNNDINIKISWVPHRKVNKIDENYVISGEIFYLDYRPEYRRSGYYDPYGFYRNYSYWQETFDGYVFTDAIIAAFDKNGNLAWDNHMFLENIKSFNLETNTSIYNDMNASLIMYYYEDNIYSKIFKGNQTVASESKTEIRTYSKSETLLHETNTKMLYWYDSYFLISGFQKLKDSNNNKRRVYFLNKIAFQ